MKNLLILTTLLFLCFNTKAQYSRQIIQFSHKGLGKYTLQNPSEYLSEKSLQRRTKYKIPIDSTDLPISSAYLDSIRKIPNVTILSTSKWLNQVLIQTTDSAAMRKIRNLSFVKNSMPIGRSLNRNNLPQEKFSQEIIKPVQRTGMQMVNIDADDYGNSYQQINMHEGQYLHNKGFLGKGITIAMLDAGYFNYDKISAFDSLRQNNRILGTWDFVKNESSVAEDHPHGLYCFSIIGANLPGTFIGTAPHASFYLFRTEDDATETPVEEHNWALAAERADSLGVDMISSSLGYSEFDDPAFNHTYQDMNGNTTLITKAADLAAKKGIIVCNSAGNSGNDAWKYITAPADGDSVLTVGAVNYLGMPASFSSFGPSASGKIKPDVTSVGDDTYFIGTYGTAAVGDGTSFSNPNIAGLIACLWQAFPEFNNMEIIDAVKKSSSHYYAPTDKLGYGIPNMKLAYQLLLEKKYQGQFTTNWIRVVPNPFQSHINVMVKPKASGFIEYELFNMSGRMLHKGKETVNADLFVVQIKIDHVGYLPRGAYNLRITNGFAKEIVRLVK